MFRRIGKVVAIELLTVQDSVQQVTAVKFRRNGACSNATVDPIMNGGECSNATVDPIMNGGNAQNNMQGNETQEKTPKHKNLQTKALADLPIPILNKIPGANCILISFERILKESSISR